jgi:hypothetical protein
MNAFYLFYTKDWATGRETAGAAGAKRAFEIWLVFGKLD